MAENPISGDPRPPFAPGPEDDDPTETKPPPPGSETSEDPAAKALSRGCLLMVLAIGLFVGIPSLLYWFWYVF